MAWHLATRLPGTLAALRDGIITRGKAEIIVRATGLLDPDEARAAEAKVLDRAGRLTPGGLRAAIARAVMEVAPKKAKERRETAAKDARVERWAEDSGNAALMGRELPPDEVLARRPADHRVGAASCARPGWRATWTSCAPAPSSTCCWARTPAPATGADAGGRHGTARRGSRPARVRPAAPAGGFAGRVTLTVPLATLAGLADRPGELAGLGPVDPWLARDLAAAAARNPKTTWCVTVTDQHGHAVGHGCARPEPKSHRKRAGPGRHRARPGSPSPRPAGTGRPAATAPGGCAPRAPGRT